MVGAAGDSQNSWGGSKFLLLEEARAVLTLASLSQPIRPAWPFPKTGLGVREKGQETFLGRTQEGLKERA